MTRVTFDPWWRTRKVLLPVVLVAVVAGVLVLRSGDDPGPREAATQAARYCDLAAQFDNLAVGTGAASAPGQYGGPREAFGTLIEQAGPMLDELQSSAPKDIRGDVKTTVGSIRDAASGDDGSVKSAEFSEAVRKTTDFRARSCFDAGTSGEG